jgi:hypothetical protein
MSPTVVRLKSFVRALSCSGIKVKVVLEGVKKCNSPGGEADEEGGAAEREASSDWLWLQ